MARTMRVFAPSAVLLSAEICAASIAFGMLAFRSLMT
jgi:hypothetical protein